MNKLIDKKEMLDVGKYSFDVSNVSVKRKQISREAYNCKIKEMEGNKEYDTILLEDMVENYGLYMIRQDFKVLVRRMPFVKAIRSYIKRYSLTLNYIKSLNETQYDVFFEWAYFNITGLKKKDLEETSQIMELEKMANEEIRKITTDPSQQRILLATFLQDAAGVIAP